jgi:hypothetical protein
MSQLRLLVTLSAICHLALQNGSKVMTKQVPNVVCINDYELPGLLYESNESHIMTPQTLSEGFLNVNTEIQTYYSFKRKNLYFHILHIHGRFRPVVAPSSIQKGTVHYNLME